MSFISSLFRRLHDTHIISIVNLISDFERRGLSSTRVKEWNLIGMARKTVTLFERARDFAFNCAGSPR